MQSKLKKTSSLKFKLAIAVLLSSALLRTSVYADADTFVLYPQSYSNPTPIYLDKSKIENINTNTSIPFNLRQFSEEEYFTSSIDEAVPPAPPAGLPIFDFPSPSQYKNVNNKISQEEIESNPLSQENTIQKDFFSPNTNDTISEKNADTSFIEEFTVLDELNKQNPDINYCVSATSTDNTNDINLEGRPISNLKINGLKSLSPDIVTSNMNTKVHSLFNQELLQKDLQQIYSTGYFSDNMSIEPKLNNNGHVDLTINVEENILVREVNIIGNSVITTSELTPFISSIQGRPQNLNSINTAIDAINNYYHEKGFLLANVSSIDDNVEGDLTFTIQEGIINEINITGNEKTKDYIIKRNIMTQPGSVYNEEYLKKDLAKVFSTQIFDEVNRNITPSSKNDGTYDVTVIVVEKTTNSVALGGGIDTGLGAFGSVSLRDDNFLGKAQKVSLSGIIGSGVLLSDASISNHMNYQVELSFFEPHFINADNSLMSKIYFREMGSWTVPLAIERRIGANIGIEHKVKGYDHLTTNFVLGAEHVNMKEGDFNKISSLYNKYNLNIADRAKQLSDGFFLNLGPGIKYSNLDSLENPREGILAQARFTESIGVTDFNHTNGRLSGMVTKFFPVFKKSSFSLSAKGGIKVHGDEMPEFMAYRLGGPYTIRGFRMNGVGTGESFMMGTAELATPLPFVDRFRWDVLKKMRLTFFVDAGKVFDPTITNTLYDRPLYAVTTGVGLRFYVPGMGPLSIDYGIPITNPGHSGSEHGYFTFGMGGMNGMYGYGY